MMNPANMQAMMQMQQSMAQLQSSGLMPAIPGICLVCRVLQVHRVWARWELQECGGVDMSSLLSALGQPAEGRPAARAGGKHFAEPSIAGYSLL